MKKHWFVYDENGDYICAFETEDLAKQFIRHRDGYYYDYSEDGI